MTEKVYTGDDYNEMFDNEFYVDSLFGNPVFTKASEFHYKWLIELGQQGKIGGQTILEIGTGTILHNTAAVARYYEHIILTDFAERLREWLREWWQGKYSSIVRKSIEPIIALEGSRQSPEDRENEMKKKLIAISTSNIRNTNPLTPCMFPSVDTVIMKWVFDAVVATAEDHATYLQNVANLLRPGGILIAMECSTKTYKVNETTYRGMDLSKETVRNIWEESQFELLYYQTRLVEYEGACIYQFNILGRKK